MSGTRKTSVKYKPCHWWGCGKTILKASLCRKHYPRFKDAVLRRAREHRKAGLCVVCSEPVSKWGFCSIHFEMRRNRDRAKYRAKSLLRKCLGCKTVLGMLRRRLCDVCKERHKEATMQKRLKYQKTSPLYLVAHRKAALAYYHRQRQKKLMEALR